MEKLNIPQGEYHTNELQTRVECDNRLVATCLDGEGNAFTNATQNIEKQKSLAILFSNAGNTYNKCGKLPSELMEENRFLEMSLRHMVFAAEKEGWLKSNTPKKIICDTAISLLTKIENNQTPQP